MTWLPAIMEMQGDWDSYCDLLCQTFERDLRSARFFGRRVGRRRTPEINGKPDGFWHVTSEHFDKHSMDRIPDLRRCERVPWIGPMIDAAGTERVYCWRNPRPVSNGHNVVIALPSYEYAVILGSRKAKGTPYMVLITAFPLGHRRQVEFARDYAAAGEYAP
jgi:hypothetical protein